MPAAKKRFVLDDQLIELVEAGVPLIVGTCDRQNRPSVTRAWGARVTDGGQRVVLFVSNTQSEATLRDLADGGWIAVTASRPANYRTFQLKGTCVEVRAVDELKEQGQEDLRHVQRYWDALESEFSGIGVPERLTRALWSEGLTRVTFDVRHCYRQTPGPEAGSELPSC